jgi:hypothetical protein
MRRHATRVEGRVRRGSPAFDDRLRQFDKRAHSELLGAAW